jgi:hypothetical protein
MARSIRSTDQDNRRIAGERFELRLPKPLAEAAAGGPTVNSKSVGAERILLSRHSVVRAARRLLSPRKITKQIRNEFGLYDLDRAPVPAGSQ